MQGLTNLVAISYPVFRLTSEGTNDGKTIYMKKEEASCLPQVRESSERLVDLVVSVADYGGKLDIINNKALC